MLNKIKTRQIITIVVLMINTAVYAEEIAPIDCMIEPNVMVELSSSVTGVLETLTVDKSDEVKKGQVIATFKSDLEQVNVRTSEQRLKLRKSEHGRIVELYREKVITASEKEQSDNDKKLSELELQHARTSLALRQIKSPIDGVVVKRYFTTGEFVENKPIIKLAQLNPLKIEVVSPVENYGKIVKGMRAKIYPEFGEYTDLIAEVVVVDKVVDAASGTFGVRLKLDNKDHAIPGGLKCKVQFMFNAASVASETVEAVTSALPEDEVFSDMSATDEALLCATLGPYKTQYAINTLLSTLAAEIKQTELHTKTETRTNYLITSDVFYTSEDARKQMRKMQAAGVSDIALLSNQDKHYIALGLYSQQSTAQNRVDALQAKGYQVEMKPRVKTSTSYWADVAYQSAAGGTLNNKVPEVHRAACDQSGRLSLLNNRLE